MAHIEDCIVLLGIITEEDVDACGIIVYFVNIGCQHLRFKPVKTYALPLTKAIGVEIVVWRWDSHEIELNWTGEHWLVVVGEGGDGTQTVVKKKGKSVVEYLCLMQRVLFNAERLTACK